MTYYMIAGEASGDLHASKLISSLRSEDPQARFRLWGGDLMLEAAGDAGTLVSHYREGAVMGFVEVVRKGLTLLKRLSRCKEDLLANRPDVLILTDYPGFNMKMARFAHEHGIKVIYYISPKVWAWKEGRLKAMKRYIDRLYIIFPFEVPYFKSKNLEAVYHGCPLLDIVLDSPAANEPREAFLSRHSLPDKKYIALLAGSRELEIDFLLPRMRAMCECLKGPEEFGFLLACAPGIDKKKYLTLLEGSPIIPIWGDTHGVLKQSVAAVVSSGTASLETAIMGTPQLVCYGGSRISIWIARHILKITTISLANMILGRRIFNEWIQDECEPGRLAGEVLSLATDKDRREKMAADYREMLSLMGERGSASRVAKDIIEFLNQTI